MNNEQLRLKEEGWKKWGPYVSDRQWGTVREDYSENGEAWEYTPHDIARSKAWRWGEEGIAGISDDQQLLCFALSLWNKKDTQLKERFFGLTNHEGNHGEDVKELYYYLDNTPTHSYMKMLYKYPHAEFPYSHLREVNRQRSRDESEYELIDTGIFEKDEYFDVFVEYIKNSPEDIFIKISIHNRGNEDAALNVLPTVWFRNTWSWGYDPYKPLMAVESRNIIEIYHKDLGQMWLSCEGDPELLFCENETNYLRVNNFDNGRKFNKDGINDYLLHGQETVNPRKTGTKAAANYDIVVPAGGYKEIKLRLSTDAGCNFDDFDAVHQLRKDEADTFYNEIPNASRPGDPVLVQRQAFAGMLWTKQFYYYNIHQWLKGDPSLPPPPSGRAKIRNAGWKHMHCKDILSMPDKWEYPWFAAWDLAFHCLPLAAVDPDFAKNQLLLLTNEWYMHPNGHWPAYEWDFGDVNPPVHALACWIVYRMDKRQNDGKGDVEFLEKVFHKLVINFTWWVNRKDTTGNNIFEGGFLGLDNIGVFDRNMRLGDGLRLEQADATSWMAVYSINLLRIAYELAKYNEVYTSMSAKFYEHFIYIAAAISDMGEEKQDLWNEEDSFFYDIIRQADDVTIPLKVRSIVGLIPLFAVEVLDDNTIRQRPEFHQRIKWFYKNRPDLADLVSRWNEKNERGKRLMSLLRGYRMKMILKRMLDEEEFLSPYGIRSLSKFHKENPYVFTIKDKTFSVEYTPAESRTAMYGGNSNWRGPIWVPINFMIIEMLRRFHLYYGDNFMVECPTGSGNHMTLKGVADFIGERLASIFLKDENGRRPVYGNNEKMQTDPHFKDYILFYEYFNGDTGEGIGASHQTGWTGLIVRYLSENL